MSDIRSRINLSKVEEKFLAASPYAALYPQTEKIGTLVVENFPALGRFAALRFLEWVQKNPGGVISLPTGKTPEHFIYWVKYLLESWDSPETKKFLAENGINPKPVPDLNSLYFVQIDEFYPIHSHQKNSFYYYVNQYYIDGFGLDPEKALLMDCEKIGLGEDDNFAEIWPDKIVDLTLRYRQATCFLERKQQAVLHRIDQWCQEYEDRINELGGIGFFLGGIGPDGHIGFNVRGSDHHSTTRLTSTNYETQAAAAQDLGGIEVSKARLVITIGLGTITVNPECVAIIIAAGETKAQVVADAIQSEKSVLYPATCLQVLPNARFYVTVAAACLLEARELERISTLDEISAREQDRIISDLAVSRQKSLLELTAADFTGEPFAELLSKKMKLPIADLVQATHNRVLTAIENGSMVHSNKRFLHTEPHHDDVMLGYLPSIVRHVREPSNTHHFITLTSGFNAVTNAFLSDKLKKLGPMLDSKDFAELLAKDYFQPDNEQGRQRDVWQFLDGVAGTRPVMIEEGYCRRLLRDLFRVYGEQDGAGIRGHIQELIHYLDTEYPGKKDPEHIQRLKGKCREWEAECLWGYLGWNCSNVKHLRLGFYTGDIFTEEPTYERDVPPILKTLEEIQPDIITVALDPEGSGPDTHYKVLQAMTAAVQEYVEKTGRKDLKIWGYRNVWFRFHPSEANLYVPVSLNMFAIMENAFLNTFGSQRDASFPSYAHDGPFCELAQSIQVDQYQKLKACLGRRWFHEHPSPMIRATRGFVFIHEMDVEEFFAISRELQKKTEALTL